MVFPIIRLFQLNGMCFPNNYSVLKYDIIIYDYRMFKPIMSVQDRFVFPDDFWNVCVMVCKGSTCVSGHYSSMKNDYRYRM
jgi:hypothetical protein